MKCAVASGCYPLLMVIATLGAAAPARGQTPADPPPISDIQTTRSDDASPPTRAALMPTWGSLFGSTLGDLRRLPSKDSFAWLGVGALGAIAGHPADSTVTRTLSGAQALHEPLEPGAIIGGTAFQLGAAFTSYALGRATNSPRAATVGADLFRAELLTEATTQALKFTVRRTRPDGSSYSFPSGHTAVSFASATVLQHHFGWKVGIPAYGLAAYVAASRVQMKRHYLSDVAFSAALGVAAGRTITIGRGAGRFAVAPTAAPAGGAINFVWVGQR